MWSSDGTRILFRFDRIEGQTGVQNNELRILDLNTGRAESIAGSHQKFNQRWSPDGRWIVATPNNEKELDLYDVSSGRWSVLVNMIADYPYWSTDSRYIYYCTHTQAGAGVYRAGLESHKPEFVASLTNSARIIDEMWGQWLGLTPDGEPLILRTADLQQIYLLSFEDR